MDDGKIRFATKKIHTIKKCLTVSNHIEKHNCKLERLQGFLAISKLWKNPSPKISSTKGDSREPKRFEARCVGCRLCITCQLTIKGKTCSLCQEYARPISIGSDKCNKEVCVNVLNLALNEFRVIDN